MVLFLSPVQIHTRRHPTIHNVHDAAAVLADAFEEIRDGEMKVEAVGMALYHLMPPELVIGFMTSDPEGGLGADID